MKVIKQNIKHVRCYTAMIQNIIISFYGGVYTSCLNMTSLYTANADWGLEYYLNCCIIHYKVVIKL